MPLSERNGWKRPAVQTVFYHLHAEVGQRAHRIFFFAAGGGVLEHDGSVAVVGISQGEGFGRQHVEETLLGFEIVLESLVVVEMVACEVGEYASGERKTGDTVLVGGMTAHFHRGE